MAYLLEQYSTRTQQYNRIRRGGYRPSGTIVIHTAENRTDTVGADGGAEAVLNWIRNRPDPGSYHTLIDADSTLRLIDPSSEAFHCRYTNKWSIGLSCAVSAADWPALYQIKEYGSDRGHIIIDRLAAEAAHIIRWMRTTYGIVVPVRRISRIDAIARRPGFIGHGDTDPARRSDPGAAFDWSYFLSRVSAHLNPQPTKKGFLMSLSSADQAKLLDKVLKNNHALGRLDKEVPALSKRVESIEAKLDAVLGLLSKANK